MPSYPLFHDPVKYVRLRCRKGPTGWLREWSETRALRRCLAAVQGVRTLWDVPCGPGRLFSFWHRQGYRVDGFDLSPEMVAAARTEHDACGLAGTVGRADAFHLDGASSCRPNVVVSVRFAYYFDAVHRGELLRALAAASSRYVLVQYKTDATPRGARNARLKRRRNSGGEMAVRFCGYDTMAQEMRAAGLRPITLVPIGAFSDRVFVLGEKTTGADATDTRSPCRARRPPRLAAALGRLWATLSSSRAPSPDTAGRGTVKPYGPGIALTPRPHTPG